MHMKALMLHWRQRSVEGLLCDKKEREGAMHRARKALCEWQMVTHAAAEREARNVAAGPCMQQYRMLAAIECWQVKRCRRLNSKGWFKMVLATMVTSRFAVRTKYLEQSAMWVCLEKF